MPKRPRTFGRERSARDGIAGDALPAQSASQVPAQVVQRGLRRRVRVRFMVRHEQPLHGPDLVAHTSGPHHPTTHRPHSR
jgi:hypothetical protein